MRKWLPVSALVVVLALLPGFGAFGGHATPPDPALAELASAQQQLLATQAELSTTTDQLSATRAGIASLQQALAAQVGRRDPTYSEAVQFISEDQTNLNKYIAGSYECRSFAADVVRNAEAVGIRAAYISVGLRQGSHAVVGFDTVDRGFVYFEPQTDREVTLPIGESYLQANGYRAPQGQDDTITNLTVVW